MAVTLTFPSDRPVDLIGFAWSPLFEAVLSMRAVVQPKRTPLHLPWVRRSRELPDDLLAEIRTLVRPFDPMIPGVFEVGLRGDNPTFADELGSFRALEPDLVAHELSLTFGGIGCLAADDIDLTDLARLQDRAYCDRVLSVADRAGHGDLARLAFDDPAGLRDRYADMLDRYWDGAFEAEWHRLLPRIEAEVTAGARALITAGAPGLVSALLPEGRWDPGQRAIVIAKDWDGSCDVAERGGLLFVPTVYGWPNVLVDLTPPWPAAVFIPLRDLRTPEVPHASDREIVAGFSALGDETRLQISRLVAEEPRSTKELAALLSLSDSAVSRHLKILEAAGLVTGQRDGYFVLYRLVPERLDVLGGAVRSTLGLAQGVTGDVPALPVSVPRSPGG
jgi:DNA-binding transcriptional ArsR family regulator